MHRTFAEVAEGGELIADVCVIGAGAAGQTVAKALADKGRQVLLLESGGYDYDLRIQDLNRAEDSGLPYYDLFRARLRLFGGATAIWGGRACRLDAIDFERRDWTPHSGWPFRLADLVPYYEMAEARLGLRSDPYGQSPLTRIRRAPQLDPAAIDAAYWQYDHHIDRFTADHRADILEHPNVTVITRATVTEIVARPNGAAVERLALADLDGRRASVRPRTVVVACGGIENARLLMASRSVKPAGLGNDSDWLGRTFMEHIHGRGGEIVTSKPLTLLRLAKAFRFHGARMSVALRTGEATQRSARVLNTSFTMNLRKAPGLSMSAYTRGFNFMRHTMAAPSKGWRKTWFALKHAGSQLQDWVDPYRPWLLSYTKGRGLYATVRAEQAPNRDSRVRLDLDKRDPLGVPRANLHWAISDLDKRSVEVAMTTLDGELRRLDLGHVEVSPWLRDPQTPWAFDNLISKHPLGGYHHMGTTRMADDPADGVTDGNGKVHGLANLYVAGSSLFPTSGWANPTLTIIALSFRLADHLASRPD